MSRFTVAAATAVLVVLATASLANAASQFGGRAKVITGTVAGVPLTLVDTGPVEPGGDALEASLLCYPAAAHCAVGIPDATGGAVSAEVFHASAVAGGSRSHATATVADTSLNVAGHTISATFLAADADVTCSNGTATAGGGAEVAQLVIDGQAITIGTQANQSVPLPGGGTVIVNEQVASASTGNGSADVSALHVIVPGVLGLGGTDLWVAKAHADAGCGEPPPSSTCQAQDFVTGGGYVEPKKTFAIAGGFKRGMPWGHLQYDDHAGTKLHGVVTDYKPGTTPTSRQIFGHVDDDAMTPFRAVVEDNGEPGRDDRFELWLGGVQVASGKLAGGNIQLHHPCLAPPDGAGSGNL